MAGRDVGGNCGCICIKCNDARKLGILFGAKHCERRKKECYE